MMQKTVLTILAASLIVGSTFQIATAAEHRIHKSDHARTSMSQQFRNANAFMAAPSVERRGLSELDEGYMSSGPAGH
jgi:hypothetical protein